MTCLICESIEKRSSFIYEDEDIVAFLSKEPSAPGHVIVTPKKHYPIIETVPDFVIGDVFKVAKKVSIAVFQGIGAHGTNIVVQNGLPAGQTQPHFMVHIVPRKENDGLKLQWEPKQASQESLNQSESKLKAESKSIGPFQKEPPKPIVIKEAEKLEESKDGKINYQLRQLRRIP